MKKKVLFIDRDGTLIKEIPPKYQIDSLEKVTFYPGALSYLSRIAAELDYELVMVTNQDGLGTESFPEERFIPAHEHVMQTFKGEGVHFSAVHIDRSFVKENAPTRKPGIGMLSAYFSPAYNLAHSFVIGDRITDVLLAKNIGCKAIWLDQGNDLGQQETASAEEQLKTFIALKTIHWKKIYEYLKFGLRCCQHRRHTRETDIQIELQLEGTGIYDIHTGLFFFDHMLEQISRHGGLDLCIKAQGDLSVDEHHTIEDTGIALGEAFTKALGDKRGIARYGFLLPMDDALAQVALDLGGRSQLVWKVDFHREKIGDVPTEMFSHFFKSFADAAQCNINIRAEGTNEHHKIESIFKAFARSLKMAICRDPYNDQLPTTKGKL